MYKSLIYCVLALLWLNLSVNAQPQVAKNIVATGLQIGQRVPNITLDISNYKTKQLSINELKGKLIILDFWATWCGPCLAMMPVLDSLQTQFKDQLQIISVTYQQGNVVNPFIKNMEEVNNRTYLTPIVTDDTELHKLFPHVYLPHFVWVNELGMVSAITGYGEVTAKNIAKAINSSTSLKQKKDVFLQYDREKPLFETNRGGIKYQSILSGRVEGIGGLHLNKPMSAEGKRMTYTNQGITSLYRDAFAEGKDFFSMNRVAIEVNDLEPLDPKRSTLDYEDWRNKYTYCYEQIIPNDQYQMAYKLMREDLGRYFPQYTVTMVKRKKLCYVLKKNRNYKAVPSQFTESSAVVNQNGFTLQNAGIYALINYLGALHWQLKPYPVIDGTGITQGVDIAVSAKTDDVDAVNKGLEKYGLEFRLEKHKVMVMQISDSNLKTGK